MQTPNHEFERPAGCSAQGAATHGNGRMLSILVCRQSGRRHFRASRNLCIPATRDYKSFEYASQRVWELLCKGGRGLSGGRKVPAILSAHTIKITRLTGCSSLRVSVNN